MTELRQVLAVLSSAVEIEGTRYPVLICCYSPRVVNNTMDKNGASLACMMDGQLVLHVKGMKSFLINDLTTC